MRVVVVTQQVDPGHPSLAATVPKLHALAALVDEVVVLTDRAVPGALPANCRVHEFGARGKLGRGARFERALVGELARRPRPGLVLAHMAPIYAVLAAPLARPLLVPLLLWFTHWRLSPMLRLAERAVDRVVSVDRRSFPLESRKLVPIGHGIDLSEFACRPAGGGGELRVLVLGRYSAAKGLETIVRAAALVPEASVVVHGPVLNESERRYRESLAGGDNVELGDAVPRAEIPGLLAQADALVNNMQAGAADKVVLEAGASCVPVLASDPGWAPLLDGLELPLRFARDDPGELAARLRGLAAAGPGIRARVGAALRERVRESHSVESWARGVLAAAR